jgi:actin beta/gamma 1
LTAHYRLPDETYLTIPASVRIGVPELFFQPKLVGMSIKPIDELAWASISASDLDLRKELCKNISMSGGPTMYEGMADRLKQEL